jgi:hypothetical protein
MGYVRYSKRALNRASASILASPSIASFTSAVLIPIVPRGSVSTYNLP